MEGILIPVKQLEEAKRRLSPYLSTTERIELGLAMLSDIISSTGGRRRFVVTSDPRVSALGDAFGLHIVEEHDQGLNAALTLGTEHAAAAGVTKLLVLPADVPAVSPEDVRTFFGFTEKVVVAPSSDGGTSGILRSPPQVMHTRFGPNSASRHLEAARAAGLASRRIELSSLLLDVDDFGDLQRLAKCPLHLRSVRVARRLLSRRAPSGPHR